MIGLKFSSLLSCILALSSHLGTYGHVLPLPRNDQYPTTVIANVTVIDTRLVRDAMAFSRAHSTDSIYNHMIRSWLLGALIINSNETLRSSVDLEVHAVASILHDVGLDSAPHASTVSSFRRFEVDGAYAARSFVMDHEDGRSWDAQRLQLLWDSVALHSTFTISYYKQPEVIFTSQGTVADFVGPQPELGTTYQDFKTLFHEFPRTDFDPDFNSSIIRLCQSKPDTTYDTWMQPFGDRYAANYTSKGHDLIDNAVTNWTALGL